MQKAVIGLTILSVVSLTCCKGPEKAPAVPPVPKHAVAGQITSTPCVYKQRDAEYPAQCGFIFVPENRLKPGSRLIALPYQRILAQTKHPAEPLFILNGGPGASNMHATYPLAWFIRERDVVLTGYRGIDGSVQLACPQVDAVLKRGGALLGGEAIADMGKAYRDCAAKLTKAGIDLAGYSVLEVVDDVEAIRQAFGYQRIDLNGISYGTRLALIYGWRYPQRVFRSALLNVNPPGRFWLDPVLLDRQLRRYSQLCAGDAYCSSRTKDLAADMKRALDNMPKRWLGIPVSRDVVLLGTFMALYSTDGAAAAFDMWIAAAKGDYSGMALLTAAYATLLPSEMFAGDTAAKGFSADFDAKTDYAADLAPGRTLIGLPLNVIAAAAVKSWPEHKIPAEFRMAQPSAVETLMLSGTLDVADPAENARNELLPLMPNAKQVTLAEFSHFGDLMNYQPEAMRHLLTTFYRTGKVDGARFTYRPVNFDPGWKSFPFLAKALLGAALLIAGAATGLLVWLFRRRRKGALHAPS
jgi:pimeloyl-ACP methyl ester carboxylesterase